MSSSSKKSFLRKIIPGSKLANSLTLQERLVSVTKTTKVTTGGRVSVFLVVVVVGDGNGRGGYGSGKSKEVSIARKKAFNAAKKKLFSVPMRGGTTISHTVSGKCGASSVFMRPAKPGTGVIAGGAAKSLLEIIGFKDVVCKCHGSSANRTATILATIDALSKLCSLTMLSKLRGKKTHEILNRAPKEKTSDDTKDSSPAAA
jgi:small subunit ribosomal protein S5